MTKTLDKKWKEMDLADDHLYYWRMPNGEVRIMTKTGIYSYKLCYDGGKIYILAPVPSYEEWKELKEQRDWYETRTYERAALINKLREQLNEANEVIRYYDIKEPKYVEDGVVVAKDPAHRYLEKWGVK